MASPKKPVPRQGHNQTTTQQSQQRTTADDRQESDDQDQDEQQVSPDQRRPGGIVQEPVGPPIFDRPVRLRTGEQFTPLAATAFARFNPREKRPQLAEHWVYSDPVFNKRGYI